MVIIKLNGKKITLCACINCKEVHGIERLSKYHTWDVDKKFKCCKNPNNMLVIGGTHELCLEFARKNNLEIINEY